MPPLMKDPEIRKRLRSLEGWKLEGGFITRALEFRSFMDGISFINAMAKVAEKQEHHPDISVRYTSITLSIQTHSEGGVTEWDFELAEAIDAMLARRRKTFRLK